jgi:hypothetical protein
MKKEYIIPVTEMMDAELNELMQGSYNLNSEEGDEIQDANAILVRSQIFLLDD